MLTINPGHLSLEDLRKVYKKHIKVELDESAYACMDTSVKYVKSIVKKNQPVYGINTGIGLFANTRISIKDVEKLQRFIVISHAVGVGPDADDGLVRLIVVLKINSLALGHSGIRPKVLEALMKLINEGVYPRIPVKGSVGASGDLAPLSHLVLVLLGEGEAKYKGKLLPASEALAQVGLKPLQLGPREGVSLINGTQVSTAFALKGLFETEDLFASAIVCGSITLEAALGSRKPFDEKVHKLKPHDGQVKIAAAYRYLLGDRSGISDSHKECNKVQDPYSLRCQPQVMGACYTQIQNAAEILLIEANSSSDNPVIFTTEDEIISAGNFHAEPVAFAADNLALALAEIGSLSERRTALLMDKHFSNLPAFLVHDGGVNTGFMTAQVTSSALVSENKMLATPASVDTIPTSANQEDHVSMAPAAGKRLWEMAENVRNVLAIEYLSGVQGLDLRNGLRTSASLEIARKALREKVPFLDEDRFMAPDIEAASEVIKNGVLNHLVPKSILSYRF